MKTTLTHFMLPVLALFSATSGISLAQVSEQTAGTLETMIVASGTVAMDLNLSRLNGAGTDAKTDTLRFQAAPNSFFPILVLNNELRGAKPGSIALIPESSAVLPTALKAAFNQLVLEKTSESSQIVVRDARTGFIFFNIEGQQYAYDAATRSLQIADGRLLISESFAKNMGRPADAGTVVGSVSMVAGMRLIEVSDVANGEVDSAAMPAVGTVPGPDVVVGDVYGLAQFDGSSGTQVGLAVGTSSCNFGVVDLNWFANPSNDHPVIPQNLYRMSGGAANTDRFEQIGQSSVKHAFTALTQNICSLGCNGVGGTHLGSGCSDPYDASLNAGPSLGSRAWINPFTGAYPRNDGGTTNNSHSGHTHVGPSHRILTEIGDLNTTLNAGATYYAEGQYVTPHEYAWCASHPGQCNMNNNVSYRRYNVTGTGSPFSFSPVGSTVRMMPAIKAWTGATVTQIEPAPAVDGIGFVGYKVTNPSAGVWRYEYAVYNQNMDRAIQSFSVPLGCGITTSNLGFHAPPQHPGWAADGTVANSGFSSTPWTSSQAGNALAWSSQTFAQNQNANAIRWGTLYNFRFDSNKPPQAALATVGFFKTGAPITVAIQAPTPDACAPLSITTAVSRKTHGGAGDFDCPLPLSAPAGIESRNSGGNHTIVFTFANNVVSGGATVVSGTGSIAGSPAFGTNTMTVNLTGVTDAQTLGVKLTGVTDVFAQVLADTTLNAGFLVGDTNGDTVVNGGDTIQTRNRGGQALDSTNFRSDVNVDGSLNSGDTIVVRGRSGNFIP